MAKRPAFAKATAANFRLNRTISERSSATLVDADPEWGALLDNLHVSPSSKGHGLGRRLSAESAA